MKKLLLLILLLINFFARSQTSIYHPFPDSNATWNVDYTCCWGGACLWWVQHEEQFSYTYGADTSINGFTYHQVLRPFIVRLDTCVQTITPTGYRGGIRQDTSLRKVFFIPAGSSNEVLLYDFNLQINDTVKGFLVSSGYGPVISEIDSMLINGNYRKRWKWQWDIGDTGYLIEGIGSSLGLLEDIWQNMDAPITNYFAFNRIIKQSILIIQQHVS